MSLTRRQALASSGAILISGLAGCGVTTDHGEMTGRLRLTEQTPETVVDEQTRAVSRREFGPYGVTLVTEAVETGSATYQAGTTVVPESIIRHDGQIIELAVTAINQTPGVRYTIESTLTQPAAASVSAAQTVAFEDLPAVDYQALITGPLNRHRPSLAAAVADQTSQELSMTLTYPDAHTESVLVPNPRYEALRYDPTAHIETAAHDPVVVVLDAINSEETAKLTTYEITATTVAESQEAYGEQVLTQQMADVVTIEPSELSDRQQEILETAINDGYTHAVSGADTDTERALLRTIFAADSEDLSEYSGARQLVRYNGTVYRAEYGVSTP